MVSEFVNVLPGVYFELCVNISISILVLSIILQEHHDFDLYVKGNKIAKQKCRQSIYPFTSTTHPPRQVANAHLLSLSCISCRVCDHSRKPVSI